MICKIEYLPNEIFIELFGYLDGRVLFQAFYNLNFRLNNLIHSLTNISLALPPTDDNSSDDFQHLSSYITTLTIEPRIDVNFDRFTNVCRLSCVSVSDRTFSQLTNADVLPYLKHFVIFYRLNQTDACGLHRKLFSNGFRNLISCRLLGVGRFRTVEEWTQSPSLRILKIRQTTVLVYQAILAACPNLHSLLLNMPRGDLSSFHIEPHRNLKRMVLIVPYHTYPQTDDLISNLLATTPNLEQFCLHRLIWDVKNIISLVDYDWLAAIIDFRLPLLRRFIFKLNFSIFTDVQGSNVEKLLTEIEEQFKKVHSNRYQSRLVIPLIKVLS